MKGNTKQMCFDMYGIEFFEIVLNNGLLLSNPSKQHTQKESLT